MATTGRQRLGQRIETLTLGVIAGLLVIVVVAAIAAAAAFGGKSVSVRGWEVILLAAVLVGIGACLLLLFRQLLRLEHKAVTSGGVTEARSQPEASPHPHAALLSRVDALDRDLERRPDTAYAPWDVAELYHQLLEDAKSECRGNALEALRKLPTVRPQMGWSSTAQNGQLRIYLGQLRALVDQNTTDPSQPALVTDAPLTLAPQQGAGRTAPRQESGRTRTPK
jgi:hypothetical protein